MTHRPIAAAPARAGAGEAARPGRAAAPGGAALAAYLLATAVAEPAVRWWLRRRAARGREDPARLGERLGFAGTARPQGRLAWLHGASLGEVAALVPLVEELGRRAPGVTCLVTAGTVAAAGRMAAVLPGRCLHCYAPVDTAAAVRRFLDHWRPDLAVRAESELWPRQMVETARRGIPTMLVNARISARSARRWRFAPGMARSLLRVLDRIEAQDTESAGRLVAMGAEARRVRVGGHLKAAAAPPACDAEALAQARAATGGRPTWLGFSTHAPEERGVAEAHRRAAEAVPGLLTILAPRHPDRGAAIVAALAGQGLSVARRALGESPGPGTDVWLADTLGETGLWLRVAPVAFVGGSLGQAGGHTPFEAAALGVAILHGPATANFASAYAALDAAGGARAVTDGAALGGAVAALLGDGERRRAMAEAAAGVRARLAADVGALAAEALALMEARA